MTFLPTYNRGDIVTVPFPFVDKYELTKIRPALVLYESQEPASEFYALILSEKSNSKYCVILAPISSTLHSLDEDYPIPKSLYRKAGLTKTCFVKTAKLFSIDSRKILSHRGTFPKYNVDKVVKMIDSLILSPYLPANK